MNIETTSEDQKQFLKILVHGDSGAGKTTLGGSAHRRFKPLFLSAESGLLSLRKFKDENGKPIKFDFVRIDSFEDIKEAYRGIKNNPALAKYDTIVIDSLTELQKICMDHILAEEKKDTPTIKDWGSLLARMTGIIRAFRDLDRNLIVTCLSERYEDPENGTNRISPMLQGKIKDGLPQYFDEVFYLFTQQKQSEDKKTIVVTRKLQTVGTDRVVAKDRSGMLAPLEEPDFCSIYDKIFGPQKAGETKENQQ